MQIRILDKYIFKEVFKTFIFGICAFSAVFIGSGTLFRIAQYITEYGASLASVAKIFVLSLPGVVIWTFPMSMLLSGLLTIGRLSGNSEITAMKSCGISFYRIAAPAIVLGAFVSVFAVYFSEYIVPWSNEAYSNVLNYEIKGNLAPQSQEHIIIKDIMFKILIKCFKKFQDVIAMHKIDIINDTDSNVIIKAPIKLNDIEFKQLSFFLLF